MNRGLSSSTSGHKFEYRPFVWDDLQQLKILQNQLFPVQYFDNFYKRLLNDSFVTVLVWHRLINDDRNENDENEINKCSFDDFQIEFKDSTSSSSLLSASTSSTTSIATTAVENNLETFDYSKYELVGVATGRITKDQGLGSFFYQTNDGYLMTFGIKEQFRSKGIGSELLNNICKLFYKRKCDKVYLHVKKGNDSAFIFYIKNGFTFDEEIINYYRIDNVRYSALSMSKDLRPKERRSNWHSFLSLLRQTNQNFDDDDEVDDEVNQNIKLQTNNSATNTTITDISNKKNNFLFALILLLFLIVTLILIAKNNNNKV